MTAVPGSGADLAGAAAIPPTDLRFAVRSGDTAVACRHPGRHTGNGGTDYGERDRLGHRRMSGTQPRTFGDLLIACVTSYGDAGIGTTGITETSGTLGERFAVTVGTAASIF